MTLPCTRCHTPIEREHIDSPGDLCRGCEKQTAYYMLFLWVGIIIMAAMFSGCATLEKTVTAAHEVRKDIEAIPGVTALVDAYYPDAALIRVGLDAGYTVGTGMVMRSKISLSNNPNPVQ